MDLVRLLKLLERREKKPNRLGSIYVWASGDGGANDDCNCDGYAASMWTISINSAINDGRTALYDESCSSTLASTFSNGRSEDPQAGSSNQTDIGKTVSVNAQAYRNLNFLDQLCMQ